MHNASVNEAVHLNRIQKQTRTRRLRDAAPRFFDGGGEANGAERGARRENRRGPVGPLTFSPRCCPPSARLVSRFRQSTAPR